MMTTMNAERAGFEQLWAIRGADDEGNLGAKPLRSEADPQRYRGSAAQGSWVWFQRGAAWQRAQGAVPEGFMPIPTAEQLAEALDNVRSFHDMSAELIAPELLTNLLAALAASTGQEVGK